jgi:signal transduction histidine kinase
VLHGYADGATGVVRVQAQPAEDGWLQLRVSDDGCGISADNLRHIFDPFFTTRLGQGGSGLGLHITYTLVTGLLGGHIDVHSVPGQGTTFTLRLPSVAPSPAEAEPAATEDIAA